MKKSRQITRTRNLNTYAILWNTSWCLLEAGKERVEGSFHQFLSSIAFTAFTLEAFLNHVGKQLFNSWPEIDPLSPWAKLSLVCEKLDIKIEKGKKPWQTLAKIIRIRNQIAHGKSIELKDKYVEKYSEECNPSRPDQIKSEWEAFSTAKNAELAREEVRSVIMTIQKKLGVEEHMAFDSGITGWLIEHK